MKDFKADFRGKYQHLDIIIWLDADLAFGAPSIHAYFEDQISKGVVFRAGETVQIGWMIVMLKADAQGDLEVWEPRFGTVPIDWVRGANSTFRQFMLQKTVAEQIDAEPAFPSLRQSAVESSEFRSSQNFRMFRGPSGGSDSGWIFTSSDVAPTAGKTSSLFEIASACPAIIPFLALPVGAAVTYMDNKISVEFRDKKVDSDFNEFIKRLTLR